VPTIQDYVSNIEKRLPPATKLKKVLIVGAGMAGLSAAYELMRAGHDPLILDAQPRVSGRILRVREPFMQGLYAEAGAMRLPRTHRAGD
jgi:monoamine oxidase